MSNDNKISIHGVLKYDPNRAYFGKLTGAGLADAYRIFKHTQDWDKPIIHANVTVGKIDGGVICRALWNEMSYNPVRFGRVSPFIHNGVENIYFFCRNGAPASFPEFEIIEKIHHKMIDFMTLNGRAKGQWYDKIDTKDGIVTINFVDGHSDDNYKVLTGLREMIRLVTSQNLKDLRRKKYNTEMLKVIKTRHPNGVRGANSVVQNVIGTYNVPQYMTPEEIIEDRLDKAEENAQITLDNQKYVSNEQYEQAVTDVQDMINMKTKDLVR